MRKYVRVEMRRPADNLTYAYLLGLYLGDGCITAPRRSLQLVIACDARYPGLIEAAAEAVAATGLWRHVRRHAVRDTECVRVVASSPRWAEAFPQHGPGRKHDRAGRLLLAVVEDILPSHHQAPNSNTSASCTMSSTRSQRGRSPAASPPDRGTLPPW